MSSSIEHEVARLDPRDQEYVAQLEPEERPVVVSALVRHRRQPLLEVGDELPYLAGLRLNDRERVLLGSLVDAAPLVLVFGSFT